MLSSCGKDGKNPVSPEPPEPEKYLVNGVIKLETGSGAPYIFVGLAGKGGYFLTATNSVGEYFFSDIPDGEYILIPNWKLEYIFNPPIKESHDGLDNPVY